MKPDLKGRSFLKILDYSTSEILYLLERAKIHKREKKEGKEVRQLTGKNIVLIFEKMSTRTRSAFEVAAFDQGAGVTYLSPDASQTGKKESVKDTARVLGRIYDAIEYRGYGQEIVETLAKYSGVPVWNGLTNEFHPTQVMADLLTIKEHFTKPLSDINLTYMGDARNNMAHSLMAAAAKTGMNIRIAGPTALQPNKEVTKECIKAAKQSGAKISITTNPGEAVKGADIIYTDVWVSMGESSDVWDERINLLKPYRVNSKIMEATGNSNVKFMHCLPAIHNRETETGEAIYQRFGLNGAEVTDKVFESPCSIVFDQAENRLHTIKAIMTATIGSLP
ncbi:ornithine carbamoyltransferase [Marinilabiliaceae bacterium ANBcel2]|nr:ornithine carbamoyltransferase [Marinilabiliaceae bacterium ANBcel2]